MKRVTIGTIASLLALLTAACAEPPVKPIPDAARQSVTSVAADVSGVKISDTSKVGARGSDEGSRLGAMQGAATVLGNSGGSLLGLILTPIGAAVGSAKGAAEAQPVQVVDETRSSLRLALQETDFTELLRQRLAGSRAGTVTFTTVTAGPASATTAAGAPASHVIALEYRVGILSADLVNPKIGVFVQVSAQVQSSDRRTLVHTATWSYCGERFDFVQMGANNGALLRSQIDQAAMVLGEAIPYDLYASRQPRSLKAQRLGTTQMYAGCMDFSDLPSRTGQPPVILPPLPSATPTPAAAAPPPVSGPTAAVAPTQVVSAAPAAPSPNAFDGTWQIEMAQLTTTYGTTSGGECPASYKTSVTFANGVAETPRGKLSLSSGELSGWMNVPAASTSMLPFIVNLSGRAANDVLTGSVSGRCTGNFVMRRQSPGAAAAATPAAVDGAWLIDMQVSSTFCLSQGTSVAFANRTAEGPWGKLQVTGDGELGGWMKLRPLGSGSLDYLVNLSGRLESGSIAGTFSGRCSGTFTMKKQ